MDEELLKTFVAVHDARSITRAARSLHCSQPAVTRRIAQLEMRVGAPLFERVPSGMMLSAAGEAFLPFAMAALGALRDGRQAVHEVREENVGAVTVAIVGTLAGTWLTGALRRVAERHPRVDLRLRTATSSETVELVRRGDATFGIGYAPVAERGLACETLFEEELVVVCAPSDSRAGRRVEALSALREDRWLAFPERRPGPETSARLVNGLLAAAGVPEHAVSRIDSLTAQKRLVEAGAGLALMQRSAIAEEVTAGTLARIRVRDADLRLPVTLTYRANGYLSRAAQTLLAELRRRRSTRTAAPRGR